MNAIGAVIIGFLLGLIWCYYQQLKTLSKKRDVISAGSDFYDAGENLYNQLFGQKL
jgi:hypothetical protein